MHNPSTTSTSSSAAESHRSGGEKCLAPLVPLYLALSLPASRTSPGLRPAAARHGEWSCYNMLRTPGLVDQNGHWTIFFRPLGDIHGGTPSHHPGKLRRKLGATWIRSGAAMVPKHETKAELGPPYAEGYWKIWKYWNHVPLGPPPSLAVQPANRPGHCHLDCTE